MPTEHPHFSSIKRLAVALFGIASALVVAACAPTRVPFLTLVPQSAPAAAAIDITATCPPGSTRLGGGFLVSADNRNTGLVIRASRPVDPNGWELQVDNTTPVASDSSAFLVTAYCGQRANLPLSATTVIGAPGGVRVGGGALTPKTFIDAACTAPAVLTGGGYDLDGPLDSVDASYNGGILESAPEGSSWHVEFGEGAHSAMTRLVRAYAICTTGLPAGSMLVASTPPGPDIIKETEAVCAATAYTTAGGFRLNNSGHGNPDGSLTLFQGRAYQSAAVSDWQKWSVETMTVNGGAAQPASVSLCAAIP